MFSALRNFFKSKIGIAFMMGFLGLIALAFAGMDVSTTGTFGGVAGGDRVAVVGDRKISSSELNTAVNQGYQSARQQSPTLSLQAFLTDSTMNEVVDQLVQRLGLEEYARSIGLRAGDRLVDSEILQIPAFRGPDGNFSEDIYRMALSQQGLSESVVRADFATGLMTRQLLLPVTYGTQLPDRLARRYTALLKEQREGQITLFRSDAFAPTADPTEAQLTEHYTANRNRFLRPERRTIRYATFGEEALGDLPAPSEAQIAARYEQDRAQYAPSETRRLTQMVVPTEDAARAVLAETGAGKTLEVAAREKGLATTSIGPVARDALAGDTSQAVAEAAFAASGGAIAAPARGRLGWYVLRVDEIIRREGRTLAQAREEIAARLVAEQRRAALEDLTAQIEEELDRGGSLREVARELGIELQTTQPATADGRIYERLGEQVPQVLASALSTIFAMDEEEPQLTPLLGEENRFLVFEAAEIQPSAAAPLAEIREIVTTDWRMSEGSKAARAAADRVLARLAEGNNLAAALAGETVRPAVDDVRINRVELQQMGGRVPPVLALFFSMAQGTHKKLEAPNNAGWFVVDLTSIEPGEVTEDDPVLAGAKRELGPLSGDELAQQFTAAALEQVGTSRNPAAIRAVLNQLTGRIE